MPRRTEAEDSCLMDWRRASIGLQPSRAGSPTKSRRCKTRLRFMSKPETAPLRRSWQTPSRFVKPQGHDLRMLGVECLFGNPLQSFCKGLFSKVTERTSAYNFYRIARVFKA